MSVLLGNTFPLALLRREIHAEPISVEEAIAILGKGFKSFWGHKDTLGAVSATLCVDATPSRERPALTLDEHNYPVLDDVSYEQVLVFSPEYIAGFRPQYGVETKAESILGWTPLLISF